MSFEKHTLDSIIHLYKSVRATGERAIAQLDYEDMIRTPGEEMNNIAIIIGHLRGNMLSRWSDFLTSDGEKPWRTRDAEFEPPGARTRDDLLAMWNEGWNCCESALISLTPEDLQRTITIRGQEHTVLEALHRQLHHYSYHIGQLVQLARMWKGKDWQTLSIAKGESKNYKPSGQHGEARL